MSSKVIDEKIVSMKFDNSKFKSGAEESITILEKLKKALKINESGEGFDKIVSSSKEASKSISSMTSSVNEVSKSWSALDVVAISALANITNKAIDAGSKIVSALTIQPVTTGLSEYEEKMGSIQSIMAGLGYDFSDSKGLSEVKDALEDLNLYADKTIYSFRDMTSNIGKFINSGVSLEDSVNAIKGVSNLAALSGATAEQASHSMYNFAQALSSGYVKLIDWKSIEVANMATVGFKDILLETAEAMGTLEKVGDGMYETLTTDAKGQTAVLSSTLGFNDSLSKQWLTTDVLTEALKQYSDETTDVGRRANEAATQIKTLSQLFDTLKESAQSGWAVSWEYIIGDFNEAKETLTQFNDFLTRAASVDEDGIVDKGGILWRLDAWRNQLLKDWHDNGGRIFLFEGIANSAKALGTVIEPITDVLFKFRDAIFGIADGELRTNNLVKITKAFREISSNWGLSEKAQNGLRNIVSTLELPFNTALALAKKLASAILYVAETAGKAADNFLAMFSSMKVPKKFEDIFGTERWSKISESITNVTTKVTGLFSKTSSYFNKIYENFKNSSFFSSMLSSFDRIKDGILDSVVYIFEKLDGSIDKVNKKFTDLSGSTKWNKFKNVATESLNSVGDGILLILDRIEKLISPDGIDKAIGLIDKLGTTFETIIGAISSGFMSSAIPVLDSIKSFFSKDAEAIEREADNIEKSITRISYTAPKIMSGNYLDINSDEEAGYLGTVRDYIENIKDYVLTIVGFIPTLDEVGAVLKSFGDALVNFITPSRVFTLAIGYVVYEVIKIVKTAVDATASISFAISGVISRFATLVDELSETLEDWATSKKIGSISDLIKAITMLIVALASIVALAYLAPDQNKLRSVLDMLEGSFTLVMGILAATIALAVLFKDSSFQIGKEGFRINDTIGGLGSIVRGISAILLSFTALIAVLSVFKVTPEDFDKYSTTLRNVVGMIGLVSAVMILAAGLSTKYGGLNNDSEKSIKQLGSVVSSLAAVILSFAVLTYVASNIDESNIEHVKSVLLYSLIALGACAVAVGRSKGDFSLGASVLSVGGGLFLFVSALNRLANMDWNKTVDGLIKMGFALAEFIELAVILKVAGKAATSVGLSFLGITASLLLFGVAIDMYGALDKDRFSRGLVGMAAVLGIILLIFVGFNFFMDLILKTDNQQKNFTTVSDKLKSIGLFLMEISAAVVVLSAAVIVLGSLKLETLKKGIGSVAVMLFGLTGWFWAISKMAATFQNFRKTITIVIASIIGIAGSLFLLSNFVDADKLKNATTCLVEFTIVMTILIGMIGIVENYGKLSISKTGQIFAILFSITISILLVIKAMTPLATVDKSVLDSISIVILATAGAIVTLFTAMATLSNKMKLVSWNDLFKSLGSVAIAVGAIVATVYALSKISESNIDLSKIGSTILSIGAAISLISVALTASAFFSIGDVLLKSLGLAAIAVGSIVVIAGILSNLDGSNIKQAAEGLAALWPVLLTSFGALTVLSALHINPGAIILIGAALSGLMIALGVADWKSGHWLAEEIGTFFGTLVGSFQKAQFEKLKGKADDVTEFVEAIAPAFEALDELKDFDSEVLKSLDGLFTSLKKLIGKSGELTDLSADLASFGHGIHSFIDELWLALHDKDEEDIKIIKSGVEVCAEIVGVISAISKNKNLDTKKIQQYGISINDFGGYLKNFIQEIASSLALSGKADESVNANKMTIENLISVVDTITKLTNIAKDIAMIPRIDMGLDAFGEQLNLFAPKLLNFQRLITEGGGISAEALGDLILVTAAMVDISQKVPTTNGITNIVNGTKDLGKFGKTLEDFAMGFMLFYSRVTIRDISKEKLDGLISVVDTLVTLSNKVPNQSGIHDLFTTDLGEFGTFLAKFEDGFSTFYEGLDMSFDPKKVEDFIASCMAIIEFTSYASDNFERAGLYNVSEALFSIGVLSVDSYLSAYEGDSLEKVKTAFSNFTKFIKDTVSSYLGVDGDSAPWWKKLGNKTVKNIYEGIGENLGDIETSGEEIGNRLAEGIDNNSSKAETAGRNLVKDVSKEIQNGSKNGGAESAGSNFVNGFANGINKNNSAILAAGNLATRVLNSLKASLKIHSPSKATEEFGMYMNEGLSIGLDKYSIVSSNAAESVGDRALESMSSSIAKIGAVLDSDMDFNPTISPIVDLNGVERGASAIASMLDNNYSFKMGIDNADRIDRMNNRIAIDKNENYSNNNVVDAINRLYDNVTTLSERIDGLQVVMDSGTLVGSIAPQMDMNLGNFANRSMRERVN